MNPALPGPPTNCIPKHHIYTFPPYGASLLSHLCYKCRAPSYVLPSPLQTSALELPPQSHWSFQPPEVTPFSGFLHPSPALVIKPTFHVGFFLWRRGQRETTLRSTNTSLLPAPMKEHRAFQEIHWIFSYYMQQLQIIWYFIATEHGTPWHRSHSWSVTNLQDCSDCQEADYMK